MQLSALVADHLHLIFLPAEHRFLDQHFARRRGVEPALDDAQIFLAVIGDAAAGAAQREGRADDRGQADHFERLERLGQIVRQHGAGVASPILCIAWRKRSRFSALSMASALAPIISTPRRFSVPSLCSASAVFSAVWPPMVGSSAIFSSGMLGALALDDLGDDLRRDRLDIGGVGQIRVGHDRRRIGIHQDDPVSFGAKRLAGLGAGIVEFASLADDDRAGSDDQDGVDVCALGHRSSAIGSGRL